MTTQEIKIAGFRLFEAIAIAKMNVFNGCSADSKIVEENLPRLKKMVGWFKENDLMADFNYFVNSSGKFNAVMPLRFQASALFNEITK